MIIDGHTQLHEGSLQAGDSGYGVDDLVKALDRARVDAAVLMDGCVARRGDVRESNAHALAAVRAYPGRLIAFANIKLGAGARAALDEMERTVGAGDFRGICLDPALDQIAANSLLMHPVIDAAIQFDVPVWIATGVYPHATPTLVGALAAAFPRARIICGHMGGELYYDALCAGRRCPSLYFDISFQARTSFQAALRELGASRLIYGSGLPLTGAAAIKDMVQHTRMPVAARARILGGNLAGLLGAAAIKDLEKWAGQTQAFA